ncbi:hypothetical protein DRH27_02950 [Candidatus Falkowbacteria bacterium]|nr:MAG: hypothetical protein DRH27_02950 [Candidatus Falkowbacteria bacterium]
MTERSENLIPQVGSANSATPRIVFKTMQGAQMFPGGKIIDGSKSRDPSNTGDVDVLLAGLLMGKITSGGKYAPSIIGPLTSAYAASDVRFKVGTAVATEIARRIGSTGSVKVTGPPAANGTVATSTMAFTAVDATTGYVTITALGTAFADGSFIQPTDGSETIKTFIPNQTGIKVTSDDSANANIQFPLMPVGGQLDASQIGNYPSDTSLIAYIKAALRASSLGFVFDDDM